MRKIICISNYKTYLIDHEEHIINVIDNMSISYIHKKEIYQMIARYYNNLNNVDKSKQYIKRAIDYATRIDLSNEPNDFIIKKFSFDIIIC